MGGERRQGVEERSLKSTQTKNSPPGGGESPAAIKNVGFNFHFVLLLIKINNWNGEPYFDPVNQSETVRNQLCLESLPYISICNNRSSTVGRSVGLPFRLLIYFSFESALSRYQPLPPSPRTRPLYPFKLKLFVF